MNEPSATVFLEYTIARYLDLYVSPIIVVLGTIGNILSFIVYNQPKQRVKPLSIYIRSLAVADTCALAFYTTECINRLFVIVESYVRCKATAYIKHFLFNICEYIIVSISVSHFLAVVYPMRAAETTTRPKVIIVAIVVTCCLVNLYQIWTTELSIHQIKHKKGLFYRCITGQHSSSTATFVMWFNTTISFVVPLLVVFAANARIVMELKMKKKKRSQTIRVHREVEGREKKE